MAFTTRKAQLFADPLLSEVLFDKLTVSVGDIGGMPVRRHVTLAVPPGHGLKVDHVTTYYLAAGNERILPIRLSAVDSINERGVSISGLVVLGD